MMHMYIVVIYNFIRIYDLEHIVGEVFILKEIHNTFENIVCIMVKIFVQASSRPSDAYMS